MDRRTKFLLLPIGMLILLSSLAFGQTTNLLKNGGFDTGKPSLWTAEAGTSGATLTWASDQAKTGSRSLKIAKTGTAGSARWISGNNVRYWVDNVAKGVDIKVGAMVKTSGVNTSPATADAKWQLKFWFYDTLGAQIGTGPFVVDVDQSTATRDWYADTNAVGSLLLSKDAYKVQISAEAGANATGTVWFDNFIFVGRAGAWAGQNWNGFVDADSAWQYWIAPNGGNDGDTYFPGSGVTSDVSRSSPSSLKIVGPVGRKEGELIFFSETVPIPANSKDKQYVLSAWVKTSQIKKDSVFNAEYTLGFTWTWHSKLFADRGGWNEVGGGDYRFILKDTASDWTQYQAILTVPDNNVLGLSVRPRAWHLWTGLSYWDDFSVSPLSSTNLLGSANGFDTGKPSLWTAEAGTSGATLTWASDQAKTGSRSLKIAKTGTAGSARWISGNNVRYWVDNVAKGVDIKVGAMVKTSGVNTSPATADAKWQLKFWFYDTLGAQIGTGPFVVDVDQSTATRDWYADTNAVGSLLLSKDAYKVQISAEAGANATGTVWFDNFIFVGRAGAWAGQNWNGFVDADSAWQYWIAPNGGNDGDTYFPGSGVTSDVSRSSPSSLKIVGPVGRKEGELIFFSETVPIPANSKDKQYVLSAWVKTSQIKKDSVFNAEYTLGFTWTWHSKLFADRGGWNEVGGGDYRFILKDTASDWTQYQAILTVPDNNVLGLSVRPRAWHLWTGLSYWDDYSVNAVLNAPTYVRPDARSVDGTVPANYALGQNYPNPFNPSTTIHYELPSAAAVTLEVFNIIGQKVATLVNETQSAGKWSVRWDAKNDNGKNVSSGIYLYRLSTPNVLLTRKMILLK